MGLFSKHMKTILIALLITLAAISAVAQKEHVVTIQNERLDGLIANRTFYIDSVIDHRANKENIGQVLVGLLWTKHKAITNKELAATMMDYYTYGLPSTNNQIPVTILLNKFWLMETLTLSDEKVVFQFDITYVVNNNQFYQSTLSTDTSAVDVTNLYDHIIRKALKQSLIDFSNSNSCPIINLRISIEKPIGKQTITTNRNNRLPTPCQYLSTKHQRVRKQKHICHWLSDRRIFIDWV
jgi:hypothetical protein